MILCAQSAGPHMTIAQMMLKQTRIERQDKPECASLSFDGQAANVFQACVPADTQIGCMTCIGDVGDVS